MFLYSYSYYYAVRTRSTAYMNSLEQIFVKMENLEILDVGDYNISETITTTKTWVAPLVAWLFRLSTVKTKLEYLLPFWRYSTRSKSPERDVSLFLFLLLSRSRTSFGTTCTWLQRSYRSAFEIHDFDDYDISGTITSTKTSFVPFGSVTLAPNYSENETRISHTVSEIFDQKHIALNAIFLYSYSY